MAAAVTTAMTAAAIVLLVAIAIATVAAGAEEAGAAEEAAPTTTNTTTERASSSPAVNAVPSDLNVVTATTSSILLSWFLNATSIDGYRIFYIHETFEDVRTIMTGNQHAKFELKGLGTSGIKDLGTGIEKGVFSIPVPRPRLIV
jgi:hypothetical protein